MAKSGKGFLNLGLGRIVNIVLAILPIGWILGIITRVMRGHLLGAVISLLPIFWLIDLISIILYDDLKVFA